MIVLLMQVLRPLTRMPSRENFFAVVFSDHDYPSSSSSQLANKVVSDSLEPVDFCDLAFEFCLGQVKFLWREINY